MNVEQRNEITSFLRDQLDKASFRVKAYVYDESGRRRLGRNAYIKLFMHLNNFLLGKSAIRWVVMYGLRGAGKTTLLAQLYEATKVDNQRKLYLSVDQVTGVFGVSLKDVLSVYEDLLGTPFEKLEEPVFLFLDEVQYDSSWGLLLKTIYDRSKKVFIVATGSSALSLQASPDVARRAIFEKLYPMSFPEYVKVKNQKTEIKGLCQSMREAVFFSRSAGEAYQRVSALEPSVKKYWADINNQEVGRYMRYGSLPFMVALNNEALIYDQIKKTLERVISVDIPNIEQFSSETLQKVPAVLYSIAESDQLSLNALSVRLSISRPVLTSILETLERTETIWRVYPHGSHAMQTRQPSKYLFTSSAFRAMYFNFIGNTRTEENYKGKLLEDVVALYLRRLFNNKPDTSITYDSASGGADFIVRRGKSSLVIEVGYGSKSFSQIENTMRKGGVTPEYGILISSSPLAVDSTKNIVSIPLEFFLLA